MATQIAPTPVVKGTAAVKIYTEANQKRSQASKNGAEVETMTETGSVTVNINQAEILNDGVDWLRQKFGDVGTELFISLIIREKFDYTKWRRQFFGDKTVSEINDEAAEYSRNHPFTPQKPQVPIQREN